MEYGAIKDELEGRMSLSDFTIASMDLIDTMNMYDVDEQVVAHIYSELIEEKQAELTDTVKEVIDSFREDDDYYPSFERFKEAFNQYEDNFIDNNILRDMYNNEINDKNQMSLFEMEKIIKEELRTIHEREYEFDDELEDSEESEKNWGGAGESDEEFSASEFFGDAGDAAEADIRAEFGDDEFSSFGSMEDPRMLKDLDEDGQHSVGSASGLFKPQDSQGNDIQLKTLVKHIDGGKKGYVMGFGDDGAGNLTVRVDWAWPTDMKFTNPKEMGLMPESPDNLIVQGVKAKNTEEDAEGAIEEVRGLGSGVKNSGDRNVKLRDDHSHSPLTNINESIDDSIKSLMKTKVTKKGLKEFIFEEARKVSKQLKG